MALELDLGVYGGRPETDHTTGEVRWFFGHRPPEIRSLREDEIVAAACAAMQAPLPDRDVKSLVQAFRGAGGDGAGLGDHTFLWDFVRPWNPELRYVRQVTGACVGAGGGNMLITRIGLNKFFVGDSETPCVPFWLLPYGKSRQYLGLNDHDEGSSGATFARALGTDGFDDAAAFVATDPYTETDNYCWGAAAEHRWAYGRGIKPDVLEKSKLHTAGLAKQVTSVDEAIEHIHIHKRPITIASSIGFKMSPGVGGSRFPVLLNVEAAVWNHQMSGQAFWNHPELGELVYILNNWGRNAHGKPLQNEIPGGFWTLARKGAFPRMIAQKEVFAFDSLAGMAGPPDLATV